MSIAEPFSRNSMIVSNAWRLACGTVRITPCSLGFTSTSPPVRSRLPTIFFATAGRVIGPSSGQRRTWTKTLSSLHVLTPHWAGWNGPPRVP